MSRRLTSAILLPLLVSACAGQRRPSDAARAREALTLCVANRSESLGTIRVWVDQVRTLTVSSGRRECKPIRRVSTPLRLFAESMGGGMGGPVRFQAEITRMDAPCWEWVLGNSSTSEIRLLPCDG
jgi:hypothetical protein